MLLSIVFACLVFFLGGCQDDAAQSVAPDSARAGQMIVTSETGSSEAVSATRPSEFTKSLPDGTTITVHDVGLFYQRLRIRYAYVTPAGRLVERQMLYSPGYDSFTLNALDGRMLAGIKASQSDTNQVFSIYTQDIALWIAQAPDGDGPLEFMLGTRDDGTKIAEFDNYTELEQAIDTYLAVESGRLKRDGLTRQQLWQFERAEEIASWRDRLNGAFDPHDIRTGIELAGDIDFQAWLQSDPDMGVPDLIEKFVRILCRAVKAVKYICKLIGGVAVCDWANAIDIICDIIFEEILETDRP